MAVASVECRGRRRGYLPRNRPHRAELKARSFRLLLLFVRRIVLSSREGGACGAASCSARQRTLFEFSRCAKFGDDSPKVYRDSSREQEGKLFARTQRRHPPARLCLLRPNDNKARGRRSRGLLEHPAIGTLLVVVVLLLPLSLSMDDGEAVYNAGGGSGGGSGGCANIRINRCSN